MVNTSIEPGSGCRRTGSGLGPRYIATWLALVVIGLLATACSETRYTAGKPIDLEALEGKLLLGESSTAEVSAVLGKPSGNGIVFLPIDAHPRKMWSYYYEKGLIKAGSGGNIDAEMRRTFLFVYFEGDRYDGYMWFSSLPE